MFFNNANCDIYIGTGAGKKLMQDIDNAKHSVKILSPFLSPFLVKKLISLHHRNINIQLITTDTIEDFYGDRKRNIYELIQQTVHIDREAEAYRKRWKKIRIFLILFIILSAGFLIWFAYPYKNTGSLVFTTPILLLLIIGRWLKSKIRNKRVFSYSYKQLFPFKVVISPDKYDYHSLYLHGKIYIIDDRIAYLGSLNFTGGGTQKNYETRIRLNSREAVHKIVTEFNELFNTELSEVSIQSWGQHLYPEPIN